MDQQMTSISDRIRAALSQGGGDATDSMTTTAGEGAPARVFDANDYASRPWVADVLRAVADSRKPKDEGGAPDSDFNFDDVFEDEGEGDLSEFHGFSSPTH